MAKTDDFEETVATLLAQVMPDDESRAAAQAALDKHRVHIRRLCTSAARMGVRVKALAAADEKLIEELTTLTDHDHHDQPGEAEGRHSLE